MQIPYSAPAGARSIVGRAVWVAALVLLVSSPCADVVSAQPCIEYSDYLHTIASINSSNHPSDVATNGDYVFAAAGTEFWVIDVRDPRNPAHVTTIGDWPLGSARAWSLVLKDDLVYLTRDTDQMLLIIDVSDPTQPTILSETPTLAKNYGVSIDGNLVFVAGVEGVRIFDVSNPMAPELVSRIDTENAHVGVVRQGDFLYTAEVSTGLSGLRVIDITDPHNPELRGKTDTFYNPFGVDVAGDHAFLADGDGGLQIVDVRNPDAPIIVATHELAGQSREVTLVGDLAYVSDGDGAIHVVDVSDPASPIDVNTVAVDGPVWGRVAFHGDHAFVGRSRGLQILDVSNPERPPVLSSVTDLDDALAVSSLGSQVVATYRYRSDRCPRIYRHHVSTIDITDPRNATPQGQLVLSGYLNDAVILDSHALLARGCSGLAVVDISSPEAITLVWNAATGDSAGAIAVDSGFAYVSDGLAGVGIYDLSTMPHPAHVSSIVVPGPSPIHEPEYVLHIAARGDYAYATTFYGIQVIDVADRNAPELGFVTVDLHTPFGVEVAGAHLFAATARRSLLVFDLSDPAIPQLVAELELETRAHRVRVDRGIAYVAGVEGGVYVIDVSQPEYPRRIGSFTPVGEVVDIDVTGDHLLVTSRDPDATFHELKSELFVLPVQCERVSPVTISTMSARAVGESVVLEWSTGFESNHLGFYVSRAWNDSGEFHRISTELIRSNDDERHYAFTDTGVTSGETYRYRLVAVARDGSTESFDFPAVSVGSITSIELHDPAPNPFNPTTSISFDLPRAADVELDVHDSSGRLVRRLAHGRYESGRHIAAWDGLGEAGDLVGSGIYFARLRVDGQARTRKLVLIR